MTAAVNNKETIKQLLGYLPWTAEMYYQLRQQYNKPLHSRFNLDDLEKNLPKIKQDIAGVDESLKTTEPKNIFMFASLHYWITHASLVGLGLSALGHDVTLGYLPYEDWSTDVSAFDLRQQNAYARKVLSAAEPYMKNVSFLKITAQYRQLPPALQDIVTEVSRLDCMYTLRNEEVDEDSDLYKFRKDRNARAARVAMDYFEENAPDVVIVPNGTIQEMGVLWRYARHLGIKTVTYEFSEKRDHMWLTQDEEVMRQNTEPMWEVRKNIPLSDDQWEKIRSLFSARQNATLWENFSRLWQGQPSEGGDVIRQNLGLDDRPIVLLPTNVLGDSLTLGRNIFTKSMEDWVCRTLQYFLGRPDVQLVIRVHPGEMLAEGQSIVDVIKYVIPELPEHIFIIPADDKVNTYDLMDIATLGLVFTTTVGMEMAMRGKPVIVIGDTHYRGRGFTLDPSSWVEYYKTLGSVLQEPQKFMLSEEKVKSAWQYAYGFFFDYPLPFPWHLRELWNGYRDRPINEVISPKHWRRYQNTFAYLAGDSIDWEQEVNRKQ
jgi:hypothetical protein